MSRFRCSVLLVIALILIPFSPAQAKQTDQILWRGTVTVHYGHRAEWSQQGGGKLIEDFFRFITPLGTGAARQEVFYYKYYEQVIYCTGGGQDLYVVESKGSAVYPPFTFSMQVTDVTAAMDFQEGGVTITDYHNENCQEGAHETTRGYNVNSSPLVHDGEFSSNSTEIYGYADGGSFYNPNAFGSQGWESVTEGTIYSLSGTELETHWFSPESKTALNVSGNVLDEIAGGLFDVTKEAIETDDEPLAFTTGVGGLTFVVAGTTDKVLAIKDPPDPNYTEIYSPVTPITSQQPIGPNGDLTQAQADAFNALLTNLDKGIGLGRAILICFNRASGAQLANDSYWLEQQQQAARTYSGQYADVLDARQPLLDNLKQVLATYPGMPTDITNEDIARYQVDLVVNGLSAEQEQLLTELGVDQQGKTEILDNLILAEFPQEASIQNSVVRFPDLLTDPVLLQNIHSLAILMRQYAEGEGWKTYLPLMIQ